MPRLAGTRRALLYAGNVIPWYLAGGVSAANAVAVYKPVGAASLATSYINLANPGTYNAAPGTAPTFAAATGWTFAAASSQYLTTGITPTNNQTWSAIIRFSGANNTGYPLGAMTVSPLIRFGFQRGATDVFFYNGDVLQSVGAMTAGVIAVSGTAGYRDGVAVAGAIGAVAGTLPEIWIGGKNGGSLTPYNGSIQAVAIYNTTLTAPQVAAISAAMSQL